MGRCSAKLLGRRQVNIMMRSTSLRNQLTTVLTPTVHENDNIVFSGLAIDLYSCSKEVFARDGQRRKGS